MDASEEKDDVRVSGLSKRIMARCGGLPKVIAAVAECYKKSLEKGMYLKLKAINDNFMHILEGAPSLSGLFSWMESYLESCKDEIKPCIFYLPVFLVGQKVRARRLFRRWAAEGYVRDTSSDTADNNGISRLLAELVKNCGIIQPQISSKPMQCQVNGFFHQYITSRPLEDNLCLSLEGPCRLKASQRAGPPAQHLTVISIRDTDEAAFRNIDFSRLRSLTVFGECKPFMLDPKKIKMKYVRVLDLEDASAAATIVSRAPAQDSSTAKSSRRHALTIPSWLSKLCYQSRIDSNSSNPGVEVPAGIGKLTTLQTFGVANVGTGRVILKELVALNYMGMYAFKQAAGSRSLPPS
ncbi:Disease resistance protein RPM1 [Panicum miliaceum]|uniref:Disease resistance protein RPM1 n=1 Tax=Panicum miliaceum TaxID=4540 RepID=A0A3L6RSN5_PANMI|nr:Disease resistance protein RPM1 [Panicum miliaceum]